LVGADDQLELLGGGVGDVVDVGPPP